MSWLDKITAISLTIFVILVAIFDLRERRIPNVLVFPAMLIGMIIHFVGQGWGGLFFALKGLLTGFGLLLIPYMVKGMKAGDVKFLMAVGAFAGSAETVRILLITVLIYPLYAAFIVIKERKASVTWLRFRRILFNFLGFFVPGLKMYAMKLESQDDESVESATTPFGVAISAGALISIYTAFLRSYFE